MLEAADSYSIHHAQRYAQEKLCLGQVLNSKLMHDLVDGSGFGKHAVTQLRLLVNKDPLPRNQNVIEDSDAIHFIQARGERIVLDARVGRGDGGPADEA